MNATMIERIMRDRKLKAAEIEVRKQRGKNPAFHEWADWNRAARSGAKWTAEELESIFVTIETIQKIKIDKRLGASDIAFLAWRHGRSATAVNQKLYEFLGPRKYYQQFNV